MFNGQCKNSYINYIKGRNWLYHLTIIKISRIHVLLLKIIFMWRNKLDSLFSYSRTDLFLVLQTYLDFNALISLKTSTSPQSRRKNSFLCMSMAFCLFLYNGTYHLMSGIISHFLFLFSKKDMSTSYSSFILCWCVVPSRSTQCIF